ncbi:MAG: hypothetical protein B0D92_02445 [Spirochaeta sp. LUC14_002_19_P3]|nr:MAG: hypothetical protein B0D92_02445 [Spirochaeta sp. LUC14_002_19_P3]
MDAELESAVNKLLDGMNLALVEMSLGRHHGNVQLRLVVHKTGGVSLDDLTEAQKVIRPRCELLIERNNLTLEISSPGIGRIIKHNREYGIFTGENISILTGNEWIAGKIVAADDESVVLETGDGSLKINFTDIHKARID